ncbi:MAG: type II toxin-antitoxin system VapC family toxin, partial [Calditrichota bacterium]
DQDLVETVVAAEKVVAPDLFIAEVNNTFWKYHRFEQLPVDTCEFLINKALQLVDQVISLEDSAQEAFALAIQCEISVYDAFYLVAARRRNAYLLSADNQLVKVARELHIRVL